MKKPSARFWEKEQNKTNSVPACVMSILEVMDEEYEEESGTVLTPDQLVVKRLENGFKTTYIKESDDNKCVSCDKDGFKYSRHSYNYIDGICRRCGKKLNEEYKSDDSFSECTSRDELIKKQTIKEFLMVVEEDMEKVYGHTGDDGEYLDSNKMISGR